MATRGGDLPPRPTAARILLTLDSLPTGPLYRLLPSEDWGAGLRRIVLQQLALAQEELRQRDQGCDEAVHAARKACKRVRAVLRLLRLTLSEESYKRENQAVRDVSRRLSALRDARVMVDTAAELGLQRPLGEARVWKKLAALLGQRLIAEGERVEASGSFDAAIGSLAAVAAHSASWRCADDPRASVAAGLYQTYRRGRRAHRALLSGDGDDEQFHSWRKDSKYLLHYWIVLRAFQTGEILAVHGASRELCKCLGTVNDLAVLALALRRGRVSLSAEDTAKAARQLDRRQAELKDSARHLGHQVYWREPRDLVTAMGLESPRP